MRRRRLVRVPEPPVAEAMVRALVETMEVGRDMKAALAAASLVKLVAVNHAVEVEESEEARERAKAPPAFIPMNTYEQSSTDIKHHASQVPDDERNPPG